MKAVESVLSADLRIAAPKKYRSRYPFIDMHNRMKGALLLARVWLRLGHAAAASRRVA